MFDVIIVGGGAAGFYAAINVAELRPNTKIAIFERGKSVLSKVKVSGGGRCNVTHASYEPKKLVKNYPRGEKELLGPFHRYMASDVFSFFEERGVPLKTESDGRVFPQSDSSQSIIDCLVNEANRLGIVVLKNSGVKEFEYKDSEALWQITTSNKHYQGRLLMLATGSNEKVWQQLEHLGHNIIDPVPSLFTFKINDERLKGLQGLTAEAEVTVIPKKTKADLASKKRNLPELSHTGMVLITHWGLSGPGILGLSAWGAQVLHSLDYRFEIRVNWVPEYIVDSLITLFGDMREDEPKKTIYRTKLFDLPSRLWQRFLKAADIGSSEKWTDVSKKKLLALKDQLTNCIFYVEGKSTFKEEFVTAGGVDLKEIDFKTFKSKKLPNLYFAGEVINVDAITGGFNFQNAWTGAFLAALAMSRELTQENLKDGS